MSTPSDSTGKSPFKRARTEEHDHTSDESNQNYEHGQLWFDDGNVILVADSEGTAFRVYRGILSKNSEVFRDMFTLPQPEDLEQYEGCPVVHLMDSRVDLACILSALCDTSNSRMGHKSPMLFRDVSALLRLGSKYCIPHLVREATSRLRVAYPIKLNAFYNAHVHTQLMSYTHGDIYNMQAWHAVEAITLARTFDLHWLLPVAFYICAQLTPTALVDGVPQGDGVDAVRVKLSAEDLKRCLAGQVALQKECIQQRRFVLEPTDYPYCLDIGKCKGRMMVHRGDTIVALHGMTHALAPPAWLLKNSDLCRKCTQHFVSSFDRARSDVWGRLAKLFDLSDVLPAWPKSDSGDLTRG